MRERRVRYAADEAALGRVITRAASVMMLLLNEAIAS